jgi:hypothetical protein
MNTENTASVKEAVRRAIAQEWEDFARQHPRLVEVVDQDLLVEQAAADLAKDEEYRKAMEDGAVAGTAAEGVLTLVQRFVRRWIGRFP